PGGPGTGRHAEPAMKFLLTLACATAMTIATTGAFGQSTTGAAGGGASPSTNTTPRPSDGTSRLPPGRATSDTNKMGVAGRESPVDSDAPTAASCSKITAPQEREQCLARSRQVQRERAA